MSAESGRGIVGAVRWAWRAASEFLYPPRCVCCRGEAPVGADAGRYAMLADPDSVSRGCLCARCLSDLETSKNELCSICGRPYCECECAPEALVSIGIDACGCCFSYDKGRRGCASSRLIYSIKSTENKDSISFAASLLAERIRRGGDLEISNAVLTFAPRRSRSVREHGGDHMMMTAKQLSRLLGCEMICAFKNTALDAQKTKSASERAESASESVRLRRGISEKISQRRVILIDDIITTGSTLSACASLLYGAGADSVSVYALAKTKRSKKE